MTSKELILWGVSVKEMFSTHQNEMSTAIVKPIPVQHKVSINVTTCRWVGEEQMVRICLSILCGSAHDCGCVVDGSGAMADS